MSLRVTKMKSTDQNLTLINLCCGATILNLDESTVRKGLCGTENLTQVRQGRRVSLILEEVIELKTAIIQQNRKNQQFALTI